MSSTRFSRTGLGAGFFILCSSAFAHQLPAPGIAGIEVIGENIAGGPGIVSAIWDFAPSTPLGSTVLSGPIDTSHNSGRWQTPVGRGMVPIFSAGLPAPMVAVPTTGPGGAVNVEFVNYRSGTVPASSIVVGVGFGTMPYDLLAANGFVYAFVQPVGGGPAIVYEITVPTGVASIPSVTAGFFCASFASPYVSRMLIDPTTGNLVVVENDRIETFPTGIGGIPAVINSFVFPTNAGGTAYQAGTNAAAGFVGPGGQNMIVGLRQPNGAVGHAFLAFSTGAGAAAPIFSGDNPFGNRVLAPGFHEIAISNGSAFPVATFLADQLPISTGVGAVGQVTLSGAAYNVVTTNCPPPYGDPEARRNATGDPVLFLSTLAPSANDGLCAIGTGAANPLGALAVSGALPGLVVSTQCDRPISLPVVGPNHEAVVSVGAGGFVGTVVFPIGPGPAIGAPTPSPAIGNGPATTLPNALIGGLLGPQPVFAQGFQNLAGAGLGLSDQLVLGAPLSAPPSFVLLNPTVAMSPIPAGPLVLVPPNPAALNPALGARSTFNFINGISTAPVVVHPQHFFFGAIFGFSGLIVENPFVPFGTQAYFTANPIVTETYSY